MRCPRCGSDQHTIVVKQNHKANTRDMEIGQIRRTRECGGCGKQWPTLELDMGEVARLRTMAHRETMRGAKP
jgi:transcriptional regulator NrdR family protein